MKQQYEKAFLDITRFTESDIIVTSEVDKNNAYQSLSDLNEAGSDSPMVPTR